MLIINEFRRLLLQNPRLRTSVVEFISRGFQFDRGAEIAHLCAGLTPVYNLTHTQALVGGDRYAPTANLCTEILPRRLPHTAMWVEAVARSPDGGEVSTGYLMSETFPANPRPGEEGLYLVAVNGFNFKGSNAIEPHYAFTLGFSGPTGTFVGISPTHEIPADLMPRVAGTGGMFARLLALLHCKNIVTETYTPDEQAVRRHRRAGNPPPVSYKTLRLTVPATVQPRGPQGDEPTDPAARQRFHICRGHFKNLTHPKFKNPGLHWWPAHWRGDPEKGEVVKDYELTPAK